jgi:membrane protein required for colicin V production
MQTYDLLMLAVLGVATIFGFWKGLAWQVASLASLVVSYFMALRFADRVAPMVSDQAPFNKVMAMVIIYAVTSMAIWMLFRVVAGVIDGVKLKEFDRQMGAFVGFAKGVLFCIGITFVAVTFLGDARRDQIIASRSGKYIVQVLDKADAVAPPEVKEVIKPYLDRINQSLDPNYRPDPQNDLQAIGQDVQRLWELSRQVGDAQNWPQPPTGSNPWSQPPSQPPATQQPQTPASPISTGSNWR